MGSSRRGIDGHDRIVNKLERTVTVYSLDLLPFFSNQDSITQKAIEKNGSRKRRETWVLSALIFHVKNFGLILFIGYL